MVFVALLTFSESPPDVAYIYAPTKAMIVEITIRKTNIQPNTLIHSRFFKSAALFIAAAANGVEKRKLSRPTYAAADIFLKKLRGILFENILNDDRDDF